MEGTEKRESATLHVEEGDKAFDERIQAQLETLNQAINDINILSNNFQRARDHFALVLEDARARLRKAYKRYPYGIEQARPYFELREKCLEAKIVLRDLNARYRDACLDLEDAKEAEVLAEQTLTAVMATAAGSGGGGGGISDPEVLAKLNFANDRVIIAHNYKQALGQEKERYTEYVDALDLKTAKTGRDLKSWLESAWAYFHLKADLKNNLDRLFFDLRQRHLELQRTKEMHKSAFEHMDQLSVEIAQRQKVSQHHHKLMQLSKFEEMEDMDHFDLDSTSDSLDPLGASSASMRAMCSFDSLDAEQGSAASEIGSSEIQYGAQAYPEVTVVAPIAEENETNVNAMAVSCEQMDDLASQCETVEDKTNTSADGIVEVESSTDIAQNSVNEEVNSTETNVLCTDQTSNSLAALNQSVNTENTQESNESATAAVTSVDEATYQAQPEETESEIPSSQTQSESEQNDNLVERPAVVAGLAVGSVAAIEVASDRNDKKSPKGDQTSSDKKSANTKSSPECKANAVPQTKTVLVSGSMKDSSSHNSEQSNTTNSAQSKDTVPIANTTSSKSGHTDPKPSKPPSKSKDNSQTASEGTKEKDLTTTKSKDPPTTSTQVSEEHQSVSSTKDSAITNEKPTTTLTPDSKSSPETTKHELVKSVILMDAQTKSQTTTSTDMTKTQTSDVKPAEIKDDEAPVKLTNDTSSAKSDAKPIKVHGDVTPANAKGDVTPVKAQSDVTQVKGKSDVTPVKVHSDATREQVKSDITPAKTKSNATPVKDKSDVTPAKIKSDVASTKTNSIRSKATSVNSHDTASMNGKVDNNKSAKSSPPQKAQPKSTGTETQPSTTSSSDKSHKQANKIDNQKSSKQGTKYTTKKYTESKSNTEETKLTSVNINGTDREIKKATTAEHIIVSSKNATKAKELDMPKQTVDNTAQAIEADDQKQTPIMKAGVLTGAAVIVATYDRDASTDDCSAKDSERQQTIQKETQHIETHQTSSKETNNSEPPQTTSKEAKTSELQKSSHKEDVSNTTSDSKEATTASKGATTTSSTKVSSSKQRKAAPLPPTNQTKVTNKVKGTTYKTEVQLNAKSAKQKTTNGPATKGANSKNSGATPSSHSVTNDSQSDTTTQQIVKPKTRKTATATAGKSSYNASNSQPKPLSKSDIESPKTQIPVPSSTSSAAAANKPSKPVTRSDSKKRPAPLPPSSVQNVKPKSRSKTLESISTSTSSSKPENQSDAQVPATSSYSHEDDEKETTKATTKSLATAEKSAAKKKKSGGNLEVVQTKTEVVAVVTKPKYSVAGKTPKTQPKDNVPKEDIIESNTMVQTTVETDTKILSDTHYRSSAQINLKDNSVDTMQMLTDDTVEPVQQNHADYEDLNEITRDTNQSNDALADKALHQSDKPRKHFRKAPPPPPSPNHTTDEYYINFAPKSPSSEDQNQGAISYDPNTSNVSSHNPHDSRPTSGHFRKAPPPPPTRQRQSSSKHVHFNTDFNRTACIPEDYEEPIYENIDDVLNAIRNSADTSVVTNARNSPDVLVKFQDHTQVLHVQNEVDISEMDSYMYETSESVYENLPAAWNPSSHDFTESSLRSNKTEAIDATETLSHGLATNDIAIKFETAWSEYSSAKNKSVDSETIHENSKNIDVETKPKAVDIESNPVDIENVPVNTDDSSIDTNSSNWSTKNSPMDTESSPMDIDGITCSNIETTIDSSDTNPFITNIDIDDSELTKSPSSTMPADAKSVHGEIVHGQQIETLAEKDTENQCENSEPIFKNGEDTRPTIPNVNTTDTTSVSVIQSTTTLPQSKGHKSEATTEFATDQASYDTDEIMIDSSLLIPESNIQDNKFIANESISLTTTLDTVTQSTDKDTTSAAKSESDGSGTTNEIVAGAPKDARSMCVTSEDGVIFGAYESSDTPLSDGLIDHIKPDGISDEDYIATGDAAVNDAFSNVMEQYASILVKDSYTSSVQENSSTADADISKIAQFDDNTVSCGTQNVDNTDISNATDVLLTNRQEKLEKSRDTIIPDERSITQEDNLKREEMVESSNVPVNDEKEIMKPVHSLVKYFEKKNAEQGEREQDDTTALTFQLNL